MHSRHCKSLSIKDKIVLQHVIYSIHTLTWDLSHSDTLFSGEVLLAFSLERLWFSVDHISTQNISSEFHIPHNVFAAGQSVQLKKSNTPELNCSPLSTSLQAVPPELLRHCQSAHRQRDQGFPCCRWQWWWWQDRSWWYDSFVERALDYTSRDLFELWIKYCMQGSSDSFWCHIISEFDSSILFVTIHSPTVHSKLNISKEVQILGQPAGPTWQSTVHYPTDTRIWIHLASY